MTMEYVISIISLILGGGLLKLFQWLNTKNQEKHKANADVEKAEAEADKAQLDVVADYNAKSMELITAVYENVKQSLQFNEQNSIQNSHLLDDVRAMKNMMSENNNRLDDIENEQSTIVEYLNGEYMNFKKKKAENKNS